jgi:hypothetical protein
VLWPPPGLSSVDVNGDTVYFRLGVHRILLVTPLNVSDHHS